AGIPGSQGGGPGWHGDEHLRLVHGQRRLHAGLPPCGAVRLRGLERGRGKPLRPGPDAQGAEGRHSDLHGIVVPGAWTEGWVNSDPRLAGREGKMKDEASYI